MPQQIFSDIDAWILFGIAAAAVAILAWLVLYYWTTNGDN